jgi:hypothetical protein
MSQDYPAPPPELSLQQAGWMLRSATLTGALPTLCVTWQFASRRCPLDCRHCREQTAQPPWTLMNHYEGLRS